MIYLQFPSTDGFTSFRSGFTRCRFHSSPSQKPECHRAHSSDISLYPIISIILVDIRPKKKRQTCPLHIRKLDRCPPLLRDKICITSESTTSGNTELYFTISITFRDIKSQKKGAPLNSNLQKKCVKRFPAGIRCPILMAHKITFDLTICQEDFVPGTHSSLHFLF